MNRNHEMALLYTVMKVQKDTKTRNDRQGI